MNLTGGLMDKTEVQFEKLNIHFHIFSQFNVESKFIKLELNMFRKLDCGFRRA